MLKVTTRGSFSKTEAFLQRMKSRTQFAVLHKYGPMGVAALSGATPQDTGLAASSWTYEIVDKPGYFAIHWYNIDVENGFHVVMGIQYGHATRNGSFTQGFDFINPAMRPIFDRMVNDMWKEVTK